ncbi:DUF3368 domain-containing protein [soil metagenome]
MTAISDTSPLILCSRIGQLELLRDLFDEILVPQAVWDAIMIDGGTRPGAQEIAQSSWIQLIPGTRQIPDHLRQGPIDPGKTEVIALALERNDPELVLILDDDPARSDADSRGLSVVGSAGVALLAKRRGLIDLVTPVLAELQTAGLYLSASVAAIIIRSANEANN